MGLGHKIEGGKPLVASFGLETRYAARKSPGWAPGPGCSTGVALLADGGSEEAPVVIGLCSRYWKLSQTQQRACGVSNWCTIGMESL